MPNPTLGRRARGLVAAGLFSLFAAGAALADPTMVRNGVLTNERGMTLYTFDRDAAGTSNCNGQCATNWPPLMAPADAVSSGRYSVVTRADGTRQWALDGKPLYTWMRDANPGDTTGDGFANGAWHVARP